MTSPGAAAADAPLASQWIPVWAGGCLGWVGAAFFFLDRGFGDFGFTAGLWAVAVAVGFGTAAALMGQDSPTRTLVCALLGGVGLVLAIYPSYLIYSLLRWLALCLMFVAVARAPLMRTARDLYFNLAICFVGCCVVAGHDRADWMLWVYLAPAWVCAGLALTMAHVASRAVPPMLQAVSSMSFIAVVGALALLLFLALPRPPLLGFGFLPPGTQTEHPSDPPPDAAGGPPRASSGDASAGAADRSASPWRGMVDGMRAHLSDPHLPGWQRGLLQALLDAMGVFGRGEAPQDGSGGGEVTVSIPLWWIAALVLAAITTWLVRRHEHTLVLQTLSIAAWALQRASPLVSMKLSARMVGRCLARAGHPARAGETLRERLPQATRLPHTARHWLDAAVGRYYAVRFGRRVATAHEAQAMRRAVLDASELALAHGPSV